MSSNGGLRIRSGGLDDPRVQALLLTHATGVQSQTAPGSAHALDLQGLQAPDIGFWTAWDGGSLAGCIALKRPGPGRGEVKSMHVVEAMRRRGVGTMLLRHVFAVAREAGLQRLYLETGSWPYFLPAHEFYRRHGFVECAPFGDYVEDRNSLFFTAGLHELFV